MEIGIDSFASALYGSHSLSSVDAMEQLLDRISWADQVGLHIFGIGEHHKKEFLDSATAVILAATASRTKHIRLTSAVSVYYGDAGSASLQVNPGSFLGLRGMDLSPLLPLGLLFSNQQVIHDSLVIGMIATHTVGTWPLCQTLTTECIVSINAPWPTYP